MKSPKTALASVALIALLSACSTSSSTNSPNSNSVQPPLSSGNSAEHETINPEGGNDQLNAPSGDTMKGTNNGNDAQNVGGTQKPGAKTPPPATYVPQTRDFTITASDWKFSPGTITVHKGDTVRLKATSIDVHHGLALPDFGVSMDLQPGKTATAEFVADKAGTFTFFCSVFCGSGHSTMRGMLVVQ